MLGFQVSVYSLHLLYTRLLQSHCPPTQLNKVPQHYRFPVIVIFTRSGSWFILHQNLFIQRFTQECSISYWKKPIIASCCQSITLMVSMYVCVIKMTKSKCFTIILWLYWSIRLLESEDNLIIIIIIMHMRNISGRN